MAKQIVFPYNADECKKIENYLRKRNFVIMNDRAETEKPVLVERLDAETDHFPVKCLTLANNLPTLKGVYAAAYEGFRLPIEQGDILEVNFLPQFSDGKTYIRLRYEQNRRKESDITEKKPEAFLAAAERLFRWLRKNFETMSV
jgi:hypothetical protein